MDYVINPIWFYLIDIANNISNVFVVLLICFGVILTFLVTFSFFEDDWNIFLKVFKDIGLPIVITILGTILIPSSSTLEKMMVSSFVTYENLESTKETGKEIVDYIIEKVDQLHNGKEIE